MTEPIVHAPISGDDAEAWKKRYYAISTRFERYIAGDTEPASAEFWRLKHDEVLEECVALEEQVRQLQGDIAIAESGERDAVAAMASHVPTLTARQRKLLAQPIPPPEGIGSR